jgi:hypothetical protein
MTVNAVSHSSCANLFIITDYCQSNCRFYNQLLCKMISLETWHIPNTSPFWAVLKMANTRIRYKSFKLLLLLLLTLPITVTPVTIKGARISFSNNIEINYSVIIMHCRIPSRWRCRLSVCLSVCVAVQLLSLSTASLARSDVSRPFSLTTQSRTLGQPDSDPATQNTEQPRPTTWSNCRL